MALMFAYGSNLNLEQMARRCPAAQALGRYRLRDWRLVFRCVADIIPEEGALCYGGIWEITRACERALDAYEGVHAGLYRKCYVPVDLPEGADEALVYLMNSSGIAPPSEGYLEGIKQGYRDFGMPRAARRALNRAVRESWDDKDPSHLERQRRRRTGRPRLAARPKDPPSPAPSLFAAESE